MVLDRLKYSKDHKLKDMELMVKVSDYWTKIMVLYKNQAFKKNFTLLSTLIQKNAKQLLNILCGNS
jgi:hypothetical protein